MSARARLLGLVALALLLSCSTRPATALVFRVLGENLVPMRCDQPEFRGTAECPASAYRIESVVVRVCRGACPMADSIDCQPADLLCETYADGLMRTPRTILPGDVTVAPSDPDTPSRVGVAVIASVRIPDSDRAELIRRRFVVPFVRESTRVVEVWLSSLCIGVECPPETSCGRRSCEPVSNPPTQSFTPLPEAGVLDGGDLDATFADATRRDVFPTPSDASDASDVSAMDASDVSAMDASDASVMDASDASVMDASDASVMDASDVADVPTLDASVDVAKLGDVPMTGVDRVVVVDDGGASDAVSAPDTSGVTCPTCSGSQVCCGGACVDTATSSAHCGQCDFGCVPGGVCLAGACERLGEFAAGGDQSCALYGRTLRCWGRNSEGRLGPASVAFRAAPTRVGRAGDHVAMSATHSCSWSGGGSVGCWGRNVRGALGVINASLTSVERVGSLNADSVAVGEDFSCAAGGGEVLCWGANDLGQSGQTGVSDVDGPSSIAGVPGTAKVVAGRAHACALTFPGAGGRVYCWGANGRGQTGRGTTTSREGPALVTLPEAARDLFAGRDHTCAVLSSGSVFCWGANQAGQVSPATTTDVLAPRQVTEIASMYTAFLGAAGDGFSCAVVERRAVTGNVVLCWGTGAFGELGDPSVRVATTPSLVADLSGVTAISAGAHHACARDAAGLRCWGSNRWGQLGRGTSGQPRSTPAAVRGATAMVSSIGAGYGHVCAVIDGQVRCWGKNSEGQLGTGDDAHRAEPAAVSTLATPNAVCSGEAFSCAMGASGGVQCWGRNAEGQLGRGTFSASGPPGMGVVGVSQAAAIACGARHACVIRRVTGAVSCWGANDRGQLAQPITTPTSAAPLDVNLGRSPATAIAAGGDSTCAVLSDGSVRCWGNDTVGQLGSGARPASDGGFETLSEAPLAVSGISTATGVSVGAVHACAWSGSQSWCWGFNGFAQLGRGAATMRGELPDAITGITAVQGISAGYSQSCAFDSTGPRCWGRNHAGQVGDGAAVTVSAVVATPTTVSLAGFARTRGVSAGGGSVASDVTAGATGMTCAHDGSTVHCWGSNEWGELGDGTAFSAQPAVVTFTP